MRSWLFLLAAILLEVVGTASMKLAAGFTKIIPSIVIFVSYALSFVALTLAIDTIDLTIAYSVWAAIGTALIAVIGVGYFKEPLTTLKVVSLVLIIIGVVGLNLSGVTH